MRDGFPEDGQQSLEDIGKSAENRFPKIKIDRQSIKIIILQYVAAPALMSVATLRQFVFLQH
jgi:hypothetical protein